MILRERMRDLARERAGLPPSDPGLLARAARFQNTPYRLSRVPLLVDAARVAAETPRVEAYLRALDALIASYLGSAETRSWFGLPAAADELIQAEGAGNARVRICRLDGYLSESGRPGEPRLRILENNADAPAGTVFTPRLNLFASEAWGRLAEPRLPLEAGEAPFLDYLVGAAERARPRLVVLQPAGRSNVESQELVQALAARGLAVVLADPRQLSASAEGFVCDGAHVDVLWNKINTVSWTTLLVEQPELVDVWCRALAGGGTVHVNGFGARYVAEAKTSLAQLQRPEFLEGLEPDARAAVGELLPRCRLLDGEEAVAWAGGAREELVLKERYDIRGDGVTVGRSVDDATWRERLRRCVGSGAIVQDYVEPTRVPVLYDGDAEPVELRHSLDWFLFDGKLVGLGSKASAGYRVNLFQGGTKLAVVQC